MASGTIDLGTSGYLTGRITWSATANGTTKNNSTVTASLQVKRTNSYTTTGTWSGSLNIGGTSQNFSVYSGVSSSWVTMLTFTITKSHDANGSGTCYIYGKINAPSGTSMAGISLSNSQTVTLDKIARQATLTAAADFNDEGNPKITYSNPAGNSVTSLQACIADITGSSIYIAYRDISKTGTSYTFNFTDAERETLRNLIPNANSLQVKFYVKTVIDGVSYYSNMTKTFSIVNGNPTLSPQISDVNNLTSYLTGDGNNKLVKYHSNALYTFLAEAKKGASIVAYSVRCGNKSGSSSVGTIENVESGSFEFVVMDSRGNSTTTTINKTLLEYVKLTCDLKVQLPTTSGDMTFTTSGNYYSSSFGAYGNTLNVYYRFKEADGEYSNWIQSASTIGTNTYTATTTISGLDYRKAYTVQAYAEDVLSGIVYSTEITVKSTPVFDWSSEDFAFNVPVSFNGAIMRDFIIEQGTTDNFNYRKWSSGVIEMWYSTTINTAVNTVYGNGYYNGEPLTIDFPYDALKVKPIVTLSLEPSNAQIYNINIAAVGKDSLAYYISSYSSQAATTLQVNLYIYSYYN